MLAARLVRGKLPDEIDEAVVGFGREHDLGCRVLSSLTTRKIRTCGDTTMSYPSGINMFKIKKMC